MTKKIRAFTQKKEHRNYLPLFLLFESVEDEVFLCQQLLFGLCLRHLPSVGSYSQMNLLVMYRTTSAARRM